jgi:hypothetical protein
MRVLPPGLPRALRTLATEARLDSDSLTHARELSRKLDRVKR